MKTVVFVKKRKKLHHLINVWNKYYIIKNRHPKQSLGTRILKIPIVHWQFLFELIVLYSNGGTRTNPRFSSSHEVVGLVHQSFELHHRIYFILIARNKSVTLFIRLQTNF